MSFLFNFEAPDDASASPESVTSAKQEKESGMEKLSGDAGDAAHTVSSALEKLAYEDQGQYEMEFLEVSEESEESALLRKKRNCVKDPTHENFIPVNELNLSHLPEDNQDVLLLNLCKALADTTVRVVVDYVSKERPVGYPCHRLGGRKGLKRYGSGVAYYTYDKISPNDGKNCPCQECQQSPNPKSHWFEFLVSTAKHVVYNEEECHHAVLELWFNEDTQLGICHSLEGKCTDNRDHEYDFIGITCLSHNAEVFSRLEKSIGLRNQLYEKVRSKYREEAQDPHNLVMIPSHPHGMSKHITIGKILGQEKGGQRRHLYNACTCAGSSGAPVFCLYEAEYLFYMSHAGSNVHGNYNGSSVTVEDVQETKSASADISSSSLPPACEVTEFFDDEIIRKLDVKSWEFGDHCLKLVDTSTVEHRLLEDETFTSVLGSAGQLHSALSSHSDLVAGVYEGGLKVWECGVDLAEFLSSHPTGKQTQIKGKTVLELGCGAGLPGVYCCKCGAKRVDFQDYNKEVLQLLTHTNVVKSFGESELAVTTCHYFAGDWTSFIKLAEEKQLKYDIILTAETIYNTDNYSKLHDVFTSALADGGLILLAAKTYYFGVGGCTEAFIEYIGSHNCFSVDTVHTVKSGVPRKILALRRLPGPSSATCTSSMSTLSSTHHGGDRANLS